MQLGEQCCRTNFGLLEEEICHGKTLPHTHTFNVVFDHAKLFGWDSCEKSQQQSVMAIACFHTMNKNEEARLQSQSKLHQQFEYSELAERCTRVKCIALLRCKSIHFARRDTRVST
mmetsp:Transcript_15937/g.24800  ORF Transcript_15937/g.24800 Transcript_15937/m.24800 type:complete len:116 (+) Transcript_15937:324-671(+)